MSVFDGSGGGFCLERAGLAKAKLQCEKQEGRAICSTLCPSIPLNRSDCIWWPDLFRCCLCGLILGPRAFGSLGDQSFLDGTDGHADVLHLATWEQYLDALQVGDESTLGDGGDMHTDAALLLSLAGAPDVAASGRSLAGDGTNSSHKNSSVKRSEVCSDLIRPQQELFAVGYWSKVADVGLHEWRT